MVNPYTKSSAIKETKYSLYPGGFLHDTNIRIAKILVFLDSI